MVRSDKPVALYVMPLRITLYVLTLLSAAAVLFVEPPLAAAVARGAISRRWLFLPIGVYGVFLLAYAVDRWHLVKTRSYPPGKAFFQVAFGVIFASVLLPSTIQDYADKKPLSEHRLLQHVDPEVRVAAVLALGFDGRDRPGTVDAVVGKLDDANPNVAKSAARVLSRWSGLPQEDLAGLRAWASARSRSATVTPERPEQ